MRRMFFLCSAIMIISGAYAQGTWQLSGRVHPELNWNTIKTEHFNIHYHDGIEDIARQGAAIAEQVWPTLLKQMELDQTHKIDITFTSEDEIMSGYALWTNMVFIWVDQNDVAVWLEDEKWLYHVVAHELQHVALINALKTWVPEPWSLLISGTPGWFIEGTAEYYTEKWRPYRSDLAHKWHVLKNKMSSMDPHHDGYSKLLYISDRFGDSTIVKIIRHRSKLKTYNFDKAFKKFTKTTVEQFNEDWRRHMNTYYYGYRAQKETIEELGPTATLPVKTMWGFAIAPDSMRLAVIGKKDLDQRDQSLYIATRDTAKEREYRSEKKTSFKWITGIFKSKADSKTDKKKKSKIIWDMKEVDFGNLFQGVSWSPNGKNLAYAKYHFGDNQSMVWDIRTVDVETGKGSWVTRSLRASHPDWSPDGTQILFVAHANNTSNLYTINIDGSNLKHLTDHEYDTQLIAPKWSPDGQRIAYSKAGPEGNMDIFVMDVASEEVNRITSNPEVDFRPVWHPDGSKITFTSHKGSTPNLHTVDLSTKVTIRNTDVGDAVWSLQWTPKDSTITALTLGDVDSVRIVRVDPSRIATTKSLSLRDNFTRWRVSSPEITIPGFNPAATFNVLSTGKYRFTQNIKHLISVAFPYLDGSGAFGMTSFTDAMGRHLFEVAAGAEWSGTSNPWLQFGYLNAQHGPLWGLNYYYNSRWNFRYYDESASGLYERLDGLQFITGIPVNFGNVMSSSHQFSGGLAIQNRTIPEMPYDSIKSDGEKIYHTFVDSLLPIPEEGKEGIISFSYRWLNRRPHRQNTVLPKQGNGVHVAINHANKNIFGDFTYTQLNTDVFVNLPGGGPSAVFFRIKTLAMFGTPPAQEYVGLSKDPSIYAPEGLVDLGTIRLQENHNIRGWNNVRLGDRLVFGTLEYRFPLVSQLPINVLGFTLGSVTGALLSDFGNAWYTDEKTEKWITTLGYELKFALQAGSLLLLNFSYGQAQLVEKWNDKKKPDTYFRLALINPF